MSYFEDPQQYERIHVFADNRAEYFHPEIGRPTKELDTMAGLLFSWSSATSRTRKPPKRPCSMSTCR